MTIEESIAKYNLGKMSMSQFPEIAMLQLENGIESESLIILAGMTEKDNSFEICEYLNKAIDELKISIYKSNNAAFILANYYLQEYKKGNLNIIQAIYKIHNDCWQNPSVDIVSDKDIYDSIKFGKIIANWYTFYEIDEHTEWVKKSKKSLTQVKEEIEEDLKNELLFWENDFLIPKMVEIERIPGKVNIRMNQ